MRTRYGLDKLCSFFLAWEWMCRLSLIVAKQFIIMFSNWGCL